MKLNHIPPVLKWAGGKRQLLQYIKPLIPEQFDCYYEPFIGAGAVLLELQPKKAIINDFNWELINVYEIIRDFPEELLKILEKYEINHTNEQYYLIRVLDRNANVFSQLSKVELAARTIYLNKTCYNGLYRVNSEGHFNTPIGKYIKPNIMNEIGIKKLSAYLNSADIKMNVGDYDDALKGVTNKDFVYLDPPYQPLSESSSFTNYTSVGFTFEEQKRLGTVCIELAKKGVKFLLSNSDTPEIRDLYSQFKIVSVPAKRHINSKAKLRGNVGELLIYN
jgi:DNA adenine methylase